MAEGVFFQDLAILMAVAGVTAALFSRFGWPKVLGYILAGVLLNGHTWGGSILADVASTRTAGQLGIVFLMFGMGLSFSPKDVRRVRSVAVPAAIVDTVVMTWAGYTVGTRIFGWAPVPSLFLGVAICDSATTLLAKVFDEMGWSGRPLVTNVLGISLCEDVICVGAIALATGFASGEGMSLVALGTSLGGLFLFFLTVLVVGFVLVPRLLDSVGKRGDGEALVLAALGICFFVSYLAYRFDFSLALGAFLVGLVGSVSGVRRRLVALTDPLKAMYAAVFFVSIGLLVDPAALAARWAEILVAAALIVVGKTVNVTIASVAAGVDVKTAVQSGLALAQTGEFAFMVAMLYATLTGDSDRDLFQVAVGASLITVVLNPMLVRLSGRVGSWAESKVPDGLARWLVAYRAWLEKIRASRGSPAFFSLRAAAVRLGVYAVLLLAVAVVFTILGRVDYTRFSTFFEGHDDIIFFLMANLLFVVLLTQVLLAAGSLGDAASRLLAGEGDARWQTHLRPLVRFVAQTAAVVLFFLEWAMITVSIAPRDRAVQIGSLVVIAVAGVFGWRFFVKAGHRASQRFHEALTAEERSRGLAETMAAPAFPDDVHRLTLDAASPAIGGTVVTLNIRAKTGASVVAVMRGGAIVRNIGPEWEFRMGDTLFALGDSRQVAALKDLLGTTRTDPPDNPPPAGARPA